MYENGEQNFKNPHYDQQRQDRQPLHRSVPYPPPRRDDAIMMAALNRIEQKLDQLLALMEPPSLLP